MTQPNNPLFNKNLINALIDGIIKMLSTMAHTDAKPLSPKVETEFMARGEIAGLVGMVAGKMKGNLTLSFEKDCAFEILKNMLGEEYSEINESVCDVVGELTNMIYGRAKCTLNEMGYDFQMAIPTVVIGNFIIAQYHAGATLVIPFETKHGRLFIEITVQGEG